MQLEGEGLELQFRKENKVCVVVLCITVTRE